MKKLFFIALAIAVGVILVCSACTAFVSHDRESLTKAAEAGGAIARTLVVGANFWSRYFIFCLVCVGVIFQVARRLLMKGGYW